MRWKIVCILLFSIFVINFVCAEFIFSDVGSSINPKEYEVSDYLKAKINISFQNEPLNSSFNDSLGNSINLSVLLTKIPNFGYNSAPSVFEKDSNWYMISGKGNGGFYGFKWGGTAWAPNLTINKSLPDIGDNSVPYVFYKDESLYMIAGESNGNFKGFIWKDSAWEPNSTINKTLPDIGDNSAPSVFNMSGNWYMISGNGNGGFYGFKWSGTNWLPNSTINKSLPDIGDNSAPSVFNISSTWYLLAGESGGKFKGFVWKDSKWVPNSTINKTLPDIGDNSAPSVFEKDSNWYMVSGKSGNGGFYGFKWGGTAWAPNLTINASLPNLGYILNPTLQTITSDFYVINFSVAKFSMPNTAKTFTYNLSFRKKDNANIKQIFSEQIKIVSIGDSIAKEIVDEIDRKNETLINSKNEIKKFDFSIQKMLNEALNISDIEKRLKTVEIQYKKAFPGEYEEILQNLSEIDIPKVISEVTSTNPINFYPKRETINMDVLKSIAGEGNYSEEQKSEYIDALYLWNKDNLKTNLTFKEISVIYETGNETDLRIFKFEFDKRNMKNEGYFIIEDLGDIKFYENYSEKKEDEYIYINLEDISNEIIFSTEQEVNFLGVPVFIAPSLNDLTPAGVGTITPYLKNTKKWVLFGLIVFLLLLIAVIVYTVIQIWYRRRYENYLFKNRNNLFNIMTYIQNAKKKGTDREEIMKNLRKANWKREQINYAMNKYEGKKIAGIIERPFKRVLENIDKNPRNQQIYHTKV